MAVSSTDFLEMFPEFNRAEPEMIDRALAEAERGVSSTTFGDRVDDAVIWKAAHILASTPWGQNARLMSKDGKTVYGQHYRELARECAGGFRVV